MRKSKIALAVIALLAAAQTEAQLVRTTVAQGEIEGVVENGMAHFKGIPFAEPPVGNLRWKAPIPAKAWEGTLKADHFAVQGIQRAQAMPGQEAPAISEDCLYLNVLTPAKQKDEQLPVLVWIHGGGFSTGNSFGNDGSNFAKAGIVFVSITYRLNCMGFLSLPELTQESIKETGHATSGNYGLLDQIMALQWVHDNIAAFGGDPAKVTIMGESAGAISVGMLCQSPLAKGLFRGAISESGGNMVPMDNVRIDNNSVRNVKGSEAYGLAYIQRVTGKKNPRLKDLRKLPAEVFLNDSAAFSAGGALWPCYDDYVLSTDAYVQYQQGNFNDVNVLMGTNSDEGSMFSGFLGRFTTAQYEEELRSSFAPEWRDEFKRMYPGTNEQEAFDAHSDIFREAAFAWPTYAWANLQSQKGQGKVYMYFFDQLKFNPFRMNQQTKRKQISTHAFELAFTFGPQRGGGWGGPQSPSDAAMTKIIHQYWVNFIKTGNPNGDLLPYWPAYSQGTESTMYFRDGAYVTELPNMPQLELWTRYFDWRREHPTEVK